MDENELQGPRERQREGKTDSIIPPQALFSRIHIDGAPIISLSPLLIRKIVLVVVTRDTSIPLPNDRPAESVQRV